MKSLKWLAASAAAIAFVCLGTPAWATVPVGCVQVSGSYTSDGGALVANATISFQPVSNAGTPISFRGPCANGTANYGQVGAAALTATVTGGAFTILLPDITLTTPQNVCYSVTIVDNVTGEPHLGLGYTCVQPAGSGVAVTGAWGCTAATGGAGGSCSFDSYPPNLPAQLVQNAASAIAPTVNDSDVLGQTSSQGTVNVVGTAPATGKYRIGYYAEQHALCSTGAGAVTFIFSWTGPNGTRTAQSVALTLGSTQSASLGSIQGSVPIYALASSVISYTSTVTGSCATGGPASYDAHISVEALQ